MGLAIISALALIIGGIFACYGLIVAQAPDIKEKFDVIIPFQGVIGFILIILGLIELFQIVSLINLLSASLFFGILSLLSLITKLILGFLLSYGLITKHLTSNLKEDAKGRIKSAYSKLILVQVPFGIIAILLGFLALIFSVVY